MSAPRTRLCFPQLKAALCGRMYMLPSSSKMHDLSPPHPDLLLSSPSKILASSPTQLPKLVTSKPVLSSRRPLVTPASHRPQVLPALRSEGLSNPPGPPGHTLLHQVTARGLPPHCVSLPRALLATYLTAFSLF